MEEPRQFRLSVPAWALVLVAAACLWLGFRDGIGELLREISRRPEYSHGTLIPLLSLFLIWQRRDRLAQEPFRGSWWGVALLALALLLNVMGILGSLFVFQQYALVFAVFGLVLSLLGVRAFGLAWVPLLLLLFMVPLPDFLHNSLSAKLQLLSSQIGVFVIRLFGISVHLEGNVIDLGIYRLQVAEACSGLRYLFPLMTLGFMMAYFFKAPLWKRLLLFLSSVPITILMNSFRIGVIGVLVEYFGIGQAEGFLHDFEGWAIFMASTGLMLLEIILLASMGDEKRPWREVFGIELPAERPAGAILTRRPIPTAFPSAVAMLAVAVIAIVLMPERTALIPERTAFVDFPREVGGMTARRGALERMFVDTLLFNDYLLADYGGDSQQPLNLYIAWYDSQEAGRSAHSPRSCLPAGGWVIEGLEQVTVPDVRLSGRDLRVNRAIIRLGNSRQLVYYFFKQRERILTSEYAVKWFLLWDAVTRNRTDGALVRLTVPVDSHDSLESADRQLRDFLAQVAPVLPPFMPN